MLFRSRRKNFRRKFSYYTPHPPLCQELFCKSQKKIFVKFSRKKNLSRTFLRYHTYPPLSSFIFLLTRGWFYANPNERDHLDDEADHLNRMDYHDIHRVSSDFFARQAREAQNFPSLELN